MEAVRLPVVFFVSLWLFLPDAAMLFRLPSGDDTTANATTSLVILLWNLCLTLLLSRQFFTPALWISATTCTTHSPAHFPLCELNKLCLNHQHPIPNATFAYLKVPSDLDVSVHGGGLSSPDQSLQLSTAVVLGLCCQFLDVDVGSEQVEASHLVGVNGQDLDTALLIRETWRSDDDETVRARGRGVEGKDGHGYGKVRSNMLRGWKE